MKKTLCLFITLILIVSLAGCASSKSQETEESVDPFGIKSALTDTPTVTPTDEPDNEATVTPTNEPTVTPTNEPTVTPTNEPTVTPTNEPTVTPTNEPTVTPTNEPTPTPTNTPTVTPTSGSTPTPAEELSDAPSDNAPDSDESQILRGHIICLDPGHCVTPLSGKGYTGPVSPLSTEEKPLYTEGTEGKNMTEEKLNLLVGLKLRDALQALGAEVLMTREVSEITITGIERCEIANQGGADVNIHIHADGADTPKAHGVSVLVPTGDLLGTPSIVDESVRLGQLMADCVAESTGAYNRGIMPRSDMSGFNFSEVPSVLIEMGFMTNPEEDAKLETDEYQDLIVSGMVRSLLLWYGLA